MTLRAQEGDKEKLLPQTFLNLVASLDPKLDVISKKDMLILKGDEDKLVPWEASEEFVSKLPKDKAEVVGYPGVGHAFTPEMQERSAKWIVGWCTRH
jgi:predicted esterase